MLPRALFLSSFVYVLWRQPPHCGVILVQEPHGCREHGARPLPAAGALSAVRGGGEAAGGETNSCGGESEKLSRCDSVDAGLLLSAQRLLDHTNKTGLLNSD